MRRIRESAHRPDMPSAVVQRSPAASLECWRPSTSRVTPLPLPACHGWQQADSLSKRMPRPAPRASSSHGASEIPGSSFRTPLEIGAQDIHELLHPMSIGMLAQRATVASARNGSRLFRSLRIMPNSIDRLLRIAVRNDFFAGLEQLVQVVLEVRNEQR